MFSDFSVGGVTPVFDPNLSTPATGFHTCLARITACRLATSTVDECVAAAPRCTTDTPWTDESQFDCCPSECLLEYFQLRTTESPGNAIMATHAPDQCVAGTPRCVSDHPWRKDPGGPDCCPSACLLEYFELRKAKTPVQAFLDQTRSHCYPGMDQPLRGDQ